MGIKIGIGIKRSSSVVSIIGAPTNLILTIVSNTQVRLDWTNGCVNEEGFLIERSVDGVNYSLIYTVAAGTVTYDDTGLTGNFYYWRVRAYLGVSFSSYTNVVNNAMPLILYDGNTVFVGHTQDLTTITKDPATQEVSAFNDLFASGHNMLQAAANKKPYWSTNGIEYAKTANNEYLKSATFALAQPVEIYMVAKNIVLPASAPLLDGFDVTHRMMLYRNNALFANKYIMFAGTTEVNTGLDTDTNWHVLIATFNGATSNLRIDTTQGGNVNPGNQAPNGLTFGIRCDGLGSAFNHYCVEYLIRKAITVPANKTDIYTYLKNKYGL